MPLVMLRREWPGTFRRSIKLGNESRVLTFAPGEAVELTVDQANALKLDIGVSLLPVEFDSSGKIRVISDDVVAAEPAVDHGENDPPPEASEIAAPPVQGDEPATPPPKVSPKKKGGNNGNVAH